MSTAPVPWHTQVCRRLTRLAGTVPALLRSSGGMRVVLGKVRDILRHEGWRGLRQRLANVTQNPHTVVDESGRRVHKLDYAAWIQRYDTLDDAQRAQIAAHIAAMPQQPLISVVMPVYNPPLDLLDAAIESVRRQLYGQWELCIADDASNQPGVRELLSRHAAADARIKVAYRTENGHISRASNSALELATGQYMALLDNDDILPEHALYHVAATVLTHPDAVVIYSDEDKLSPSGHRIKPYFKSAWNPELFLGHNLISHFGVYKTEVVREVGGFRIGYEGSQDYDLAARIVARVRPGQIIHIPKVLYHWRMLPGSAAMGSAEKPYALLASEKALTEHLARLGLQGSVVGVSATGMHEVHFSVPEPAPLVSIVVISRDSAQAVHACIQSVQEHTTYPHYEILLVDNGSTDPQALRCFQELAEQDARVRVLRDDAPCGFPALNNNAVQHARGEFIALLNSNTKVISPDWLDEMVGLAARPDTGVVGAKLLYANGHLQHGGIILGLGAEGVAGHMHHNMPDGNNGYYGRAILTQEVSAVTAACCVVRKSLYEQVGGLDEQLSAAFNDVDFCLKVRQAGYRNIWTPYARLYHYESDASGSFSPNSSDAATGHERWVAEAALMKARWGDLLANDPAYNPNLTLKQSDFSPAWPPRQPGPATLASRPGTQPAMSDPA